MDVLTRMREVVHDEATGLLNAIPIMDENYSNVVKLIAQRKGKVVFTGVGKSGHIGEKLAATFSSLGTSSIFVQSTEAVHGDLGMIQKDDIVILLSNSGTTNEVLALMPSLGKIGVTTVAFTSRADSILAKDCDYTLIYSYDKEADQDNLAPSTSAVVMLAIGDSMGIVLSELKNFGTEDFYKYHPGGALGESLSMSIK